MIRKCKFRFQLAPNAKITINYEVEDDKSFDVPEEMLTCAALLTTLLATTSELLERKQLEGDEGLMIAAATKNLTKNGPRLTSVSDES